MKVCPSCKNNVSENALRCQACGLSFDETSGATAFLPQVGEDLSIHSTQSADGARFAAGKILADRYRIVSLLGRGGMGEVYKAEDLKLKQIVALKFLPDVLSRDGAALARFQNEVRITRQISHPSVCRVYDIGETQGMHFLSMEFIDGEDLSILLRRIGRLPGDKANEIARQICAGLAAAHDNGVLHRDLKPANIMIDGRGRARVTDFGVSVVAKEITGAEAMSGTPAYMAPEQLTGKEVTQKSDIYSLGLVLYELFTGKRAYNSDNLLELMSLHEASSPTNPSSHVEHLDPLVERVIMRCLEKEPAKRPASAIQVAAALPGGDPLAAALAAGETPSPEMVAASGEKTGLRPAAAMAILAATIVGLALLVIAGRSVDWPGRLLYEYSPAELAHKAQDTIQRLGYTERPADSAFGLYLDGDHEQYISGLEDKGSQWAHSLNDSPSVLKFWYRQSPRNMIPTGPFNFTWISYNDPPDNDVSGMISVRLDPAGRLNYFKAVPPQVADQSEVQQMNWEPAFAAAGLDQASFTATGPTWMPQTGFDTRFAWIGTYNGQPDVPIRVEAAGFHGKATYFVVIAPWQRPSLQEAFQTTTAQKVGSALIILTFLSPLLGALILARRNLRKGRGDKRGATKISVAVFAVTLLLWIVGGDHHFDFDELNSLIFIVISQALVLAGFVWLLYIAVEPYVRRRWPQTIVSWSRLIAGDFRDPLVGRDVMIGVLAGVIISLIFSIQRVAVVWTGLTPASTDLNAWLGTREFIASGILSLVNVGIFAGLFFFFLAFILRVVLRRDWLAVIALGVLFTVPILLQENAPLIALPAIFLAYAFQAFVSVRYGLLAGAVTFFISSMVLVVNFSPWFTSYLIAILVVVIAIAGWAFHTSLGGQKLFTGSLLDD